MPKKWLHLKKRLASLESFASVVLSVSSVHATPFQNVPVRVPFSKSAGYNCAAFVWTGGLSRHSFQNLPISRELILCKDE